MVISAQFSQLPVASSQNSDAKTLSSHPPHVVVLATPGQDDTETGRRTSFLDSLIHQRADSRSKKNYNPAACGIKITFTET